jgi:hypothetical protein
LSDTPANNLEIMMLNVEINRIHSRAVCQAIGERLSAVLGPQSNELPASLLALMQQLARVNLAAPSIIRLKSGLPSSG